MPTAIEYDTHNRISFQTYVGARPIFRLTEQARQHLRLQLGDYIFTVFEASPFQIVREEWALGIAKSGHVIGTIVSVVLGQLYFWRDVSL